VIKIAKRIQHKKLGIIPVTIIGIKTGSLLKVGGLIAFEDYLMMELGAEGWNMLVNLMIISLIAIVAHYLWINKKR